MKIAIKIVLSILLFISSAYLSFAYERKYREFVRILYEFLSDYKLSFYNPGKHFHFISGVFVFSVSSFILLIFLSSIKLKWQHVLLKLIVSFTIYSICTLVYVYIDSKLKLIECTICENGLRTIKYGDIAYDSIMITSILFASIPWIIFTFKKWMKNKYYSYHTVN